MAVAGSQGRGEEPTRSGVVVDEELAVADDDEASRFRRSREDGAGVQQGSGDAGEEVGQERLEHRVVRDHDPEGTEAGEPHELSDHAVGSKAVVGLDLTRSKRGQVSEPAAVGSAIAGARDDIIPFTFASREEDGPPLTSIVPALCRLRSIDREDEGGERQVGDLDRSERGGVFRRLRAQELTRTLRHQLEALLPGGVLHEIRIQERESVQRGPDVRIDGRNVIALSGGIAHLDILVWSQLNRAARG